MIHCFVAMCLIANPSDCGPWTEIVPADGHIVTSPMECGRAGLTYYSQFNMARSESGTPTKFPKIKSDMEGDGSDIVRTWIAEQKRRAIATEPQIK